MNKLFALLVLALSVEALAVPVAINRRDVKFPTQQMVEKQAFTNPIASNVSTVVAFTAGATSAAAATLSTFSSQPDVPRNLLVTPVGTTGDVEICQVTITGTDFFGRSLTEAFGFAANAATTATGTKAFKTVTQVAWGANCESGGFAATWHIGLGEKLGLKRCAANNGDLLFSLLNGAKEGTAPTMVASSNQVSGNTADFNGTMDGSNDFVLYFFQDYSCFP